MINNRLEYNITVITKLHSKFELDLNKFSLSLVGPPLRNIVQANMGKKGDFLLDVLDLRLFVEVM